MATYADFTSPAEKMKQMESDFGWEKSGQMAFEYFKQEYFTPVANEHSKIVKDFKFLIPGHFYTFQYDPLYKDTLDYYDRRPVMLCIKNYIHPNTGNQLQLGLNLNFIPKEIRIFIVESIWKSFKKMIERDLKERDPDKDVIGRQKLLFTDNFDVYGLLDYLLETVGKTAWKFGIRQYIFTRIENAKFIDYLDWGFLSLLQAKDLTGISERELYKIYWTKKNRKGK